ncbi:MAG: S8 family serine peptidase, partial [Pseudobdellovibrionaceae bacterium]
MKTLFLKSLTYVSVVSMTAQAQAATEVIMTPLSKKGVEWLKTVKRPELISKSQKVFLSGEQKALIELGASLSAQTEVWTISADSKVESITRWIQSSSGGSVGVETRETVFEVKSTDVAALAKNQWALKNVGQSVRIDIDDLSTTEVKGKSGEDIGIDRAGVEKLSDKPVIVAVLDTGVDYTHPDLMDAIAIDLDECKADLEFGKCEKIENKDEKEACKKKYEFLDADNNGYVRDCAGWNTAEGVPDKTTGVRGNNKAFDLNGHGTHVAGIIAATGKEGVRGVSKNIRILPVKVLTASPEAPVRPQSAESLKEGVPQDIPLPDERGKKWGSALVDNVARGVLYALRNNAQVMNISLGWGQKANSPLLRQMIELATKKNVIVVAAAGNDSTDAMISPCDFEGVICAGSHDPDGKMTHFSNFGPGVDIAAPGLNVLSTWPRALRARLFTDRRGYNIANGTSQATPYVVGAAGRLLSQGVPSNEIYPRLMLGARPQEFNFATDKYVLSGNLDIARSEAVQPQVAIFPASRQVVRIPWDRVSMNLDLPIALKNFWQEGEDVSVALSAVDSEFAVIGNQTVSFAKWGEGESKTWKAQVRLANRGVRSDLVLVAEVKVAGRVIRKVPLAFDLYVPVSESLSDNFLIRSTLQDKINVGAGTVRSVTGLGEYESQFEFVQVRPSPEGTSFNFYQFDGKSNIRQIINALVKVPVGELLLIQKGKFFGATPGYTLIYRVRLADPKEPLQIHFLFFDLKMQPKAVPGKSGDNANVMIFDN